MARRGGIGFARVAGAVTTLCLLVHQQQLDLLDQVLVALRLALLQQTQGRDPAAVQVGQILELDEQLEVEDGQGRIMMHIG